MRIKINGYIVARMYSWKNELEFTWFEHDPTEHMDNYLVLGRHEIEFDVPDDFDPKAAQIAVLENQANKVRAEFSKRTDEINDRISKLKALEYTPNE